jgi:long-chain acyl-CoA synthetase
MTMQPDTLPRLLVRRAAADATRPAMREKRHGIWEETSWAGHAARVRRFAGGLAGLGFNPGDRLAVIGDNRPALYAALLAAQSLRGAGVPLWPDAEPSRLAAIMGSSRVRFAVAEDAEQLGKVLAARQSLPDLEHIMVLDPEQAAAHAASGVHDVAKMAEAGEKYLPHLDSMINAGQPQDTALLLHTPEAPGLVMLSHANLLSAAHAVAAAEAVGPDDRAVAFLPMAWIGDALYSLALGLVSGFACNCPESPQTAHRDLREIGPTILAAPPAFWDDLAAVVEDRAARASRLKRAALAWARRSRTSGFRRLFAETLVLAPARDLLGLRHLRWAHTGGTLADPGTWRLFRGLGVNLKQSYGPAELSGFAAVQPQNPEAADALGFPVPGTEIRIAASGEVIARGPVVCGGYADGGAALDAEGWWRTGDAGEIDEKGRLRTGERIAHIGRLEDGTPFFPRQIEALLKRPPLVPSALAAGDGGRFVAAVLTVDPGAAAAFVERNSGQAMSGSDLLSVPALREYLRSAVRTCDAALPPALRVCRFILLLGSRQEADCEWRLFTAHRRARELARHAGLIENALLDLPDPPPVSAGAGPRWVMEEVPAEEIGNATPAGAPAWRPVHA